MNNPKNPTGALELADLPVTVIGGYLGAGKTTLVNHLLRAGNERLAVLVNDFGEIDIDADLIESDDGATIALANGCICCSLVDGLAAALDTVLSFQPRPDRLVIEASGVADPATVAAYGHGPGLALDAVVVLVDAETIRRQAADRYVGDTVIGQLRSADILIVNKMDLVGRGEVAEVVGWLEERVDGAVVVSATDSRVDLALLFGREPTAPRDGSGNRTDRGREADRVRDGEPTSPHHRVGAPYQSWSWSSDREVRRDRIDAVMAAMPDTVLRAKGLLWLEGDKDRNDQRRHAGGCQVLQRVGRRWSLRPARAEPDARSSRLVVIGLPGALDEGWLEAQLDPDTPPAT